jgi:hypothetical protein
MYTNFYVYTAYRQYMSEPRLYWRIKKNGKWTWTPAVYDLHRGKVHHSLGELVTLWWPSKYELEEEV